MAKKKLMSSLVFEDVARIKGGASRTIEENTALAKAEGCTETLVKGKKGCTTIFYRHPDRKYIYFVTSNTTGDRNDGVIDNYTYEIIDGKNIYWNPRGDKKNIVFSGSKRVHAIVTKAKKGKSVDHKYTDVKITTKEGLRVCENYQNSYNSFRKIKKMKQHDDKQYYFTDETVIADATVRQSLEDKGYTFDKRNGIKDGTLRYLATSPSFATEDEWYEAINEYENAVYGEYRYNPVKDLSKSFDLAFDCCILGKITVDEMWEVRRQALLIADASERLYKGVDIKKYFNL